MNDYFDTKKSPVPIFLSSDLEVVSTSHNDVDFNFKNAISKSPELIPFISLESFQGMNTFANISQLHQNNVVIIVNVFLNANTNEYYVMDKKITIPDGRYNSDSLLGYLNTNCNWQVTVEDANWTSNEAETEAVLFNGFGFSGQNSSETSVPLLGFTLNAYDPCKISIFPATFAGSTNGNPYKKTYESGGSISNDKYVYAGVYLSWTAQTQGFMKMIGINATDLIPRAGTSTAQSFGFTFTTTATPDPVAPISPLWTYTLSGPTLLYFTVSNISSSSRHNEETLDSRNILGCIPINVPYGGLFQFQQSVDHSEMLQSLGSYLNLTVTLYDQNGVKVDFRSNTGWNAKLFLTYKDHTPPPGTGENFASNLSPFGNHARIQEHAFHGEGVFKKRKV